MVIAIGLGVERIFELFPKLYDILKVLGLGYLLWMAWQITNSSGSMSSDEEKREKPFTFRQISLFQWLNPKAWMMAIIATTSFTTCLFKS